MATVREIRGRIAAIKKIQQVTSAMKMVAAARLRRAQERAESARPYADSMVKMLQNLAPALQDYSHPLLEARETRVVGVIVLSAEKGLAGSYNANLMRETQHLLADIAAPKRLYVLGKKGISFLRRRGHNIVYAASMPASEVSMPEVRALAARVRQDFISGEVDEVHIVYSRFLSAVSQQPTHMRLLPFAAPDSSEAADEAISDVIIEPDADRLLGVLLPRYVDVQVYRAMTEAVASEHGARMTSMSSASDNAAEMIRGLTLTYNRVRQAAITTELNEIVGGAEALQQG